MILRVVVGVLLGASVLSEAPVAQAHGRFPGSSGIAFDPTNPEHVVVRMTFGLYDNETAVATDGWRYVCSAAAGFDSNKEEPVLTFAGDRLLLGTFRGLVVSTPDRCDYDVVASTLDRYIVGVTALPRADSPVKGSPVLALSSNGTGVDTFDVKLFESTDGAASWHELATSFSKDFLALTITAVAKNSEPTSWGTLYVSGRDGTETLGYQAVVMRSDDGGLSWARQVVQGLDGVETLPYLQGVSPTAPLTVYAAAVLDAPPVRRQANLASNDGGVTWRTYFQAEELLPGFALAPDGTKVAFGGDKTGLRVVSAAQLDDAQAAPAVNKTRVACLSWGSAALYACGNAFVDGFSVGKSIDGGVTFEPLTQLTSACGPRECEGTTDVGASCSEAWDKEAKEIIAPATCTPVSPPVEPESPSCGDCATVPGRARPWLGRGSAGFEWVLLSLGAFLRRRRRCP